MNLSYRFSIKLNESDNKKQRKILELLLKKFRISSDTFRNRLCRYDIISEIVCGLVN